MSSPAKNKIVRGNSGTSVWALFNGNNSGHHETPVQRLDVSNTQISQGAKILKNVTKKENIEAIKGKGFYDIQFMLPGWQASICLHLVLVYI